MPAVKQQISKRSDCPEMNRRSCQIHSGAKDIAAERVSTILDRLNSFDSAEEITNVIEMYTGRRVLSNRMAQRILNTKVEIGTFQDLHQVAIVPGIGPKKFTTIISALGNLI